MSKQTVNIKKHLITSFNRVNETNINLQGLTEINDKEKWLIWSCECAVEKQGKYMRINEIRLQRLLSLETILNEDTAVHEITHQNPEDLPEFLPSLENDVKTIFNKGKLPYGVFGKETYFTEDFQNDLKALTDEFSLEVTLSKEVNGKKIYTFNPLDFFNNAIETWQAIKPFVDVAKQVNRENGKPITIGLKKGIRINDLTPREFISIVYAMSKNNK